MKKNKKNVYGFLITILLVFIFVSPVCIVCTKAQLTSKNRDVETLRKKVISHQKKNESLTMKVNELVSLENMQSVAAAGGLAYINNNIIVIKK